MAPEPFVYREYAYLSITGYGPSSNITNLLDLAPDEEWSEGDPWRDQSLNQKRFSTSWTLNSGLPETENLNAHIRAILDQIKRKRDKIQSILGDYDVKLVCVSYNLQSFSFEMDFELQRTLTAFGIRIWFDAYNHQDPHAQILELKSLLGNRCSVKTNK